MAPRIPGVVGACGDTSQKYEVAVQMIDRAPSSARCGVVFASMISSG